MHIGDILVLPNPKDRNEVVPTRDGEDLRNPIDLDELPGEVLNLVCFSFDEDDGTDHGSGWERVSEAHRTCVPVTS